MKQLIIIVLALVFFSCSKSDKRTEISLNGQWEITKTDSYTNLPESFESTVPVPGLVDLATPELDTSNAYISGVYWYKTEFKTSQASELAELKLNKAKYHSRVYLNGEFVGEHVYCFTPRSFNIKEFLNAPGESNELMIAVGTVSDMPDTVIWGHDFEKLTYIPGIYDDVTLVQSGYPFIRNIQTVPQIEDQKVRIVANIETGGEDSVFDLSYKIKELASGAEVAKGETNFADFEVEIPDYQLWTPESPFLYELTVSTGADEKTVRFGMRSFTFDPKTNRAMLNGEPFYMRGTNVCIFRFFEDPDRGELPWDEEWATELHQKFKSMNWNSIRYCIGFPPERWYEIADSLGFIIQDEYPIWTLAGTDTIYPNVSAQHIANELELWLPDRWNHPCVVIWDVQNESVYEETGEAIELVRGMDLSKRPWENGWSVPLKESDPYEAHPYLFSRYWRSENVPSEEGPLKELIGPGPTPMNDVNNHFPLENGERYPNPIIINEYGWIWLNRDGMPTTLTDRVWDVAFDKNLSPEERLEVYAKHLGILTEYWRTQRSCAGILHFCGLAYSRSEEPRGQTSDHFIDIKNLVYEPNFVEYVKPAFAPVGIMINCWDIKVNAGEKLEVEVLAINDIKNDWDGEITLSVQNSQDVVFSTSKTLIIPAYEKTAPRFMVEMPKEPGSYSLVAEINYNGEKVKSIREFEVVK